MIALLALCLRLGFWQLERGEQKRQLIDAGTQNTSINEANGQLANALWKTITLNGNYLAETPYLLDNQSHQGQPGYQVFSRFALNDGQQLLVNRGWVAQNDASTVQAISATNARQSLNGIVAPYRRAGMRLGPPVVSPPNARPVVVNYPTQQEWEALFEQALLPFTIWLAADQPNGYLRDWQVQSVPPEKHLGYAFQWFAMATAVAVISLILLLRIFRQDD